MPQYSWFKIREAGRRFFYLAAWHQTSWLLFLYLVAAMAIRIGADRGHSPERGSHRGAHGAGPG